MYGVRGEGSLAGELASDAQELPAAASLPEAHTPPSKGAVKLLAACPTAASSSFVGRCVRFSPTKAPRQRDCRCFYEVLVILQARVQLPAMGGWGGLE